MRRAAPEIQTFTPPLGDSGFSGAFAFRHPLFDGPVRVSKFSEPSLDDESITAQTIGVMTAAVRADCAAPAVIQATRAAAAGAHDARSIAAAIHSFIRGRVRFVDDSALAAAFASPGVAAAAEVLVRPVDLLAMPQPSGDCDDFSMAAAAMLRAAGIPAAFKTIAADPSSPNYSHVYVLAELPGGPVPLDASHGAYLGWEAKATGKSRVWPIDDEGKTPMLKSLLRGLGFDWDVFGDIVTTGMQDASKILTPRYAVPQLTPGSYYATGPNGQTVMYQQPTGTPVEGGALSLPGGAGLSSNMLLLGGLALAAVLIVSNSRNH